MAEFVEPRVYLFAWTRIDEFAVQEYLQSIGVYSWSTDAESDAEYLIEVGGRLCYASWEPGINKNVTRVRQGNKNYIENIIKSKHGSVLEHATCSFLFQNVSRVFTAELNRHRAGCAISEASLRYVRLDDLEAFHSEVFEDRIINEKTSEANVPTMAEYFLEKMEILESWQKEMTNKFDLNNRSFEDKKIITSAMRRLAPLGLATNIMWTANMRALRHILELRTSIHSEEEIRFVFDKVGYILQEKYPIIFGDFVRNENGEWQTPNSKI